MRSFVALGAISLVGAAALFACGDDSSSDGPTGTAGAGGSAGTAGAGGGAGAAGSAGTAGAGGAAGAGGGGTGGAGGAPATPAANCTGCVQLTVAVPAVPVATTGSQAGYIFSAPGTAAPFDLSEVSSITWRVQVLTPNALFYVQPFLQTAPPEDAAYAFGSYPAQVALTAVAFPTNQWVDVPIDIAALAGGSGADAGADAGDAGDAGVVLTAFDKSKTRTIGLTVGAGATAPAGVISVEVDSVTVVGTSNFTSKTFAASAEGLSLNMYMVPTGTLPPAFH